MTVAGLEVFVIPYAHEHGQRKCRVSGRCVAPVGQRVKAKIVEHGREQLYSARRCGKTSLAIFAVLERASMVRKFLREGSEVHVEPMKTMIKHRFVRLPWKMLAQSHSDGQISPEVI